MTPPAALGGDLFISVWVTDPRLRRLVQWWYSLGNVVARRRKVLRAVARSGAGITSFHLGLLEEGYFEGKREPSFVLTLRGVSSELDAVAGQLAREFHQLYILVADFNQGITKLVSATDEV